MNGTDGASSRERSAAAVAANVERYTVRPGAQRAADPQDVVIALLDADLARAFERAREVAVAKGGVRLVGHGVTLASTWPAWVTELPGVVLSELGAYRAANPFEATAELRASYRQWIERVFAKAAPPGAAADIYFAPVVLRLFHAAFESQIFAGGIAALHSQHTIHLVGEERRAFEDVLGLHEATPRSRLREAALPPVLLAAWLAACAFTLGECVRMRREARGSFDAIEARTGARAEPAFWAGLVPDWDRMNKHLVDAVAPELQTRRRLGVILLGTLRSGMREEQKLDSVRRRGDLWPGLGGLRAALDDCEVAQAVQPRDASAYARACGAFLRASASAGLAMTLHSKPLRALARGGGVRSIAKRAASAATLDVARSMLAERAARDLIEEHDFEGRVVAFNAANAAGYTSVEWVLRRAGAITIEHTHGSGGNAFYGGSESAALIQCIWTRPEEQVFPRDRKVMVAGMPEVLKLRARTPAVPKRVLLLSNYVHRDRPYAALPFEPFQDELLRVPLLLRAELGDHLEFRWRPHPADEDAAVARGHAKVPFVALSRSRSLADDLDECDVLVSTQSTALVEACAGDVPCFVHVTPELDTELAWVPPERRFFRAEEIVAPFVAWVEALRRGDPGANDASRRARVALFGPSGRARSLYDAIQSLSSSGLSAQAAAANH